MSKRRSDADGRRFLDEFDSVRVSRFRAMGIIDPSRRTAVIPFPNGKEKLLAVAHTRLKYGGGWSYFICPKCARLAQTLYCIDDRPLWLGPYDCRWIEGDTDPATVAYCREWCTRGKSWCRRI
jgi:hypothetical protein